MSRPLEDQLAEIRARLDRLEEEADLPPLPVKTDDAPASDEEGKEA